MKPVDEERELTRLLAEETLPASLVSGLRERGPDATELASLASRLALQGIDVTPAPSSAGPAPWKKWAAAGTGSVAIAVAWLALRAPADAPNAPNAPAIAAAPSALAQQAFPLSGTTAPSAKRATVVGRAVSDAPPPSPMSASSAAEARAGVEPLPTEPSRTEPSRTEPSRSGGHAAPSSPSRAVDNAPSKGPGPSSAASPSDSLAAGAPSEIELLRDARLALRQSPARALELAEQHARLYPSGKLNQERELLAISALVALGRRTAALGRGERFDASYPTSPYRKQVADLLR